MMLCWLPLSLLPQTEREKAEEKEKNLKKVEYDRFDMQYDTHWSNKPLSAMTERDWRIFREDFNISTKGSTRGIKPMRNWAESDLSKEVKQAVERVGYAKPSPIQMSAIPLGLKQLDVIGTRRLR